MTSKNLFFNLMKEDLRRRIWTVILASIVFFFSMPVAVTMLLQNRGTSGWDGNHEEKWLRQLGDMVGSYLGGRSNLLLVLIAVVGAIICGISGYAFLHSRKQVDFYHSLPVKRETVFFVHFVDGILIYLVPYTIGMLLCWLITALYGVLYVPVITASLLGLLQNLMIYTICYLFTMLATLLTGKILINLFGVAVLFGYAPAICGLIEVYKEAYFTTLYQYSFSFEDVMHVTKWLSPFSYTYSVVESNLMEKNSLSGLLSFLIAAAVLTGLNLLLYKLRKSEKAGTAMAFSVSEPVIRILLAVPAGLVFGMVMQQIQYNDTGISAVLWLCFGALSGALLAHGIIESLYQFDIKKCLSHKIQLAGTVIVAMGLSLSFYFDWFGYDSYLPEKSKIESMALSTYELTGSESYYDENGNWQSAVPHEINNMSIEEFDAMYEIAKLCSERVAETRLAYGSSMEAAPLNGGRTERFVIKYELKNGKEVIRSYSYNPDEIMDLLAEMYRNEEYKKQHFWIYQMEELGATLQSVSCQKGAAYLKLTLSGRELSELVETYKRELLHQEFSEKLSVPPVAYLNLMVAFDEDDPKRNERDYSMYVYPSMPETIAFLRSHGFDINTVSTPDKVERLVVYYPASEEEEKYYYEKQRESASEEIYVTDSEVTEKYGTPMENEAGVLVITDPAEIAECMAVMVESYFLDAMPFYSNGSHCSAEAAFRVDEYGNLDYRDYYFLELPEFLEQRIEERRHPGK